MISCSVYTFGFKMIAPRYYAGRKIEKNEYFTLFLVSVLFIVNIVLGNSAIKHCSVALEQIIKCTMPAWTAVLQYIIMGEVLSFSVYITLIPIIFGAILVCFGDISYSILGLVLVLLSCFVSCIKGIVSKYLLSHGNKLSPMQLLFINSSLGSIELLPLSFYVDRDLYSSLVTSSPNYVFIAILLFNGFTAFALNVSNFEATKQANPLVINIAGNVKQACMVIVAMIVFGEQLKPRSLIGCVITIAGSVWYSFERYKFDSAKQNKKAEQHTPEAERLIKNNSSSASGPADSVVVGAR